MQVRKNHWIVLASTVALVSLIVFQVKWLQYATNLVEKQFDQKVSMALGAVSEGINQQLPAGQSLALIGNEDGVQCGTGLLETKMSKDQVTKILDSTFQQYDIALDYRFEIFPEQARAAPFFKIDQNDGYSCRVGNESDIMQIHFLGRKAYVLKELGWMIIASVLLLLAVAFFFLLTMHHLLKQGRLNQWNRDFFNNMAHEFRTPLTNTQLALQLLKKKKILPVDHPYANIIESENKRLLEQVERVLDISKLERGVIPLKEEDIQVDQMLEKIVAEMNLAAQAKGGQIQYENRSALDSIKGDTLHISNAIRNVIENAIKYCESAPQIKVGLDRVEGYLQLSIQDNGIGIDPAFRQTIFQKFFRITKGNTYANKGFGLGLAYVKNVVEQHAGFLKVDSQIRKGSTFYLFFPIKNALV
jgi:signal transduction histidine kinase